MDHTPTQIVKATDITADDDNTVPTTVDIEHTDDAEQLRITLDPSTTQQLGEDRQLLAQLLGEVLHGLAQLRTGHAGTADLEAAVVSTTQFLERLDGARDALVRQHAARGGSYGALGAAMGVKRPTAQSRRDSLLKREPSAMERWAVGDH